MISRFGCAWLPAFSLILCLPLAAQPQTSTAPAQTDVQIYEKFRAWFTRQPPEARGPEALDRYRAALTAEGLSVAEVDRSIRVIEQQGQRLEIERWNRILTAESPRFNTKPNAFLVEMAKRAKPGKALDVGMGQGRNAIYLAQQGWEVTGFDPADKAVAAAQDQACKLGVNLTALTVGDTQFDFGKQRWDLIVLSYVGTRHLVSRVEESLRPGGMVVVEAFHRDATKNASIGGGVVFDTNELPTLFQKLRILHYEDVEGTADFGLGSTRLVRLCAQKR
jgi:2-polyprenyl-3-methyl-5-hydroxy-6-metoxy-1,4-benzoquinol methylase